MSSTNVHSKNDNLHICGVQTIPQEPDKELEIPLQASGRGPAKRNVIGNSVNLFVGADFGAVRNGSVRPNRDFRQLYPGRIHGKRRSLDPL